MSRSAISRRAFLAGSLGLGATLLWPYAPARAGAKDGAVRFGICADVHKDIMHDADARLKVFTERMTREKVDFIIHLGDFCQPHPRNDGFMAIWRSFDGPRYHVLGNHDMDGGFKRQQTVAYYEMPARYYAFDRGYIRFIVLDGNDKTDPPQKGYARYIGDAQQRWLREQLAATDKPVVVFSHQGLQTAGGVENCAAIRKILEEANEAAGKRKVLACFNGHHHVDGCRRINEIDYIHINSMAYFWMGSKYTHIRYSDEVDKAHPYIKYTAPYREPVFAIVTLQADGRMEIEGTWTDWVGPSPSDVGYPQDKDDRIVPGIRDRRLEGGDQ